MTRAKRPAFQKERGERQEARILAVLAERPMTSRQLAEKLSLSVDSIIIYVNHLRTSPRRIYACGFAPNGYAKPSQVFALGDLPCVVFGQSIGDRHRVLLQYWLKTPRSGAELELLMGLSRVSVMNYLADLRDAKPAKLVHIKEHRQVAGQGAQRPVYALGNKPDAVARRRTSAEIWAGLDAEQREHKRRQQRTYEAVCRARKRPQNPFSALFVGVRAGSMTAEG
jgi:biotin operon repressor